MTDENVLGRINGLVDEEHKLRQQVAKGEISSDEEHARLKEVEEALEEVWRRRQAPCCGGLGGLTCGRGGARPVARVVVEFCTLRGRLGMAWRGQRRRRGEPGSGCPKVPGKVVSA